jgi:hypothetical protein
MGRPVHVSLDITIRNVALPQMKTDLVLGASGRQWGGQRVAASQ